MDRQEQVEWDHVNKLLQHHGFKPVHLADPVENKNLSDLMVLDKKSAGEIRATLRTMLTDSDRRQALIQELVKSNNQLKAEIHGQSSQGAQQSLRVTELEELLDTVRTKVQDLEDRCLSNAVQQHTHTQQLQQEKQEAQKRVQVLEQKLSTQREEAAQLQRKLYFTIKEEERRLDRQSRTIQHICNTISQQKSPSEQQLVDVIDFYETRMTRLLDELRAVKGEPDGHRAAHQTKMETVSPLKSILNAYQEQQRRSQAEVGALKREVQRLKQELETRPSLRDIKHYNTRLLEEDNTPEIREDSLCSHYHHVLSQISAVLTNPNAPSHLHRQTHSAVGLELAELRTILPTLEAWAQQLRLLKDLHQGLNKLTARLMPWQGSDTDTVTDVVKVEDMMLLVDAMLENTSADDEKVLSSPTKFTLSSMVSHFQKLFDVASLSGVYPRMNEVYARLGEMSNAWRNLREALDLDSRVSPTEVVNHVARLASSTECTAGLQNLLGCADIDSIVVKVKQHEEFFPAFHALMVEVLHTLGVRHLGDVLPALRSLKQAGQ